MRLISLPRPSIRPAALFAAGVEVGRLAILTVACAFFFFFRLGDRDLWGSHEARAAQNAQRMLDDRSFALPRLFDDRYDLQKPPMYYWLVALGATANDGTVDATTARLPAALAATACVGLVYLSFRIRGRPTAGMIAALALVSFHHFVWLGRTARIDMPLGLAVSAAILATTQIPRASWSVLGLSLALAAGVLLKGPIGAALPLAVLGTTWLLQRRVLSPGENRLKVRIVALGVMISLIVAIPWFIDANRRTHGDFMRVFFWYHNVQRVLGGAEELAAYPWWYYAPRLLIDAAPASLIILPAAIWYFRRGRWRDDHLARLGLVWCVVAVVVLSCSRFKRADYLIPIYPGLALFLGGVGERLWQEAGPRIRRLGLALATGLAVAMVGGWFWFLAVDLPRNEPQRELKSFAREIRARVPQPQVVLFFRVEAHALAFHLGRPVNTFLEWENLEVWAGRPGPHYLVMPVDCAESWRTHLATGELEELLRSTDLSTGRHDRPLVLMRTRPPSEARDGPSRK